MFMIELTELEVVYEGKCRLELATNVLHAELNLVLALLTLQIKPAESQFKLCGDS
jgi:hypothetical protein